MLIGTAPDVCDAGMSGDVRRPRESVPSERRHLLLILKIREEYNEGTRQILEFICKKRRIIPFICEDL